MVEEKVSILVKSFLSARKILSLVLILCRGEKVFRAQEISLVCKKHAVSFITQMKASLGLIEW